jgi:MFS family permease
MPLVLVLIAMSALMLSNGGRMVPAMAMITSSVVPRLRGGFMGANSAIQHLSSSLGVIVAGFILVEPKNGPIERFPVVGLIAALVSLSTLWLAGRLRREDVAADESGAEPVNSERSEAVETERLLSRSVATRGVLAREEQVSASVG